MKTQDMTEGSPVKLILGFAIPLFIGNIFQQVYSLVDTMIAGYNLGDSAIAAIGATSSIYSLMMNFAWGLNGGYSILVTQSFGSHDREKFKRSTAAMVVLNVAGAVLLTALSLLFLRPLMDFLNTPESIYGQAHLYIAIICGGMGATLVYNMFAGFLRAMGNSRTPLYFLILSSVLNLCMDVLFVVVLKLGIGGAACATVIAQLSSAVFCGAYIWKNYREYLPEKKHFRVEKALYMEMLSAGFSMAMMQCIFAVGSVILQRAVNSLGDTVITAHTAARRIVDILMMPLSTISSATSTFVSQNWGAKKLGRIRSTLRKSIGMEMAWGVVAAVVVYCFGSRLIVWMTGTKDTEVIANAVMNLRINFFFYPELGVLICLRMAMQAMGQKIAPLVSSSLELLIKVVSSIWIIPVYGYRSASFTEPFTWLACMVLLVAIFIMTAKKRTLRCTAEKSCLEGGVGCEPA